MTPIETLKRFGTRATVLGTYWPDYRDAWLRPTRSDGAPDRVLDAGCGRGESLAEFKRFGVPVDYYGVDLGVGDPTWQFRVSAVADLHRLPFRSASFDKIMCNQVLEHVDDPNVVLAELARVVRPGGKLFFSLPFVWHLHQEPYDRFRFSRHALEYMLRRHDLVADLIQPMGGYFSVLRYVLAHHSLVTNSWPEALRSAARPLSWALEKAEASIAGPLAFALDHLDRDRKLTLGYFLHLSRPAASPGAERALVLPEDPYACPRCRDDAPPLVRSANAWSCPSCGAVYDVQAGVPILTKPGSYRPVTDRISYSG